MVLPRGEYFDALLTRFEKTCVSRAPSASSQTSGTGGTTSRDCSATSVSGVAVSMAALGVTASFVLSPVSPGLADAVEAMGTRSFGSVFSLVNVAYAVGMMGGPLVGSALVETVGIRGALVATGALFALYLVPLALLPPPTKASPATLSPK